VLPSTDGALFPFWSPDSRAIGFFAQGKLKKIAASGGLAESICDVLLPRGGTWNRDDVILFSPSGGAPEGIQRVSAAGGVPTQVFKTKQILRYPHFLPDGVHFLYTQLQPPELAGVYIATVDGAGSRRLLPDRSSGLFAPDSPGSSKGRL